MAFQQTQHRPQASRQLPIPQPEPHVDTAAATQLQRKRTLDESEEWVLFSPQAPSTTNRTHTTDTDRTPRTAGLSRLSDFGSLDTAARSDQVGEEEEDDNITCQGTEIEDDAELDSLDDGLHAFHEPSEYGGARQRLDTSGGTVLPTHDGLGTFQASSSNVQNQLWQFERYNPRRTKASRRRSSVQRQLDRLEENVEFHEENEKMRRIEKWRVEQSIALLEEIERETRRMRRMSRATVARSRADSIASEAKTQESSMPGSFPEPAQEAPAAPEEVVEQESFWSRFTQRIIRDLMGIDESILSVIFGEELPEEAKVAPADDASTTAESAMDLDNNDAVEVPSERWEHRVLERIARELGILVHQLSEHPGAFSTYARTQEAPSYAGLPNISTATIPENAVEDTYSTNPTTPGGFTSLSSPATPGIVGANAYFPPTVPHRQNSYSEASLWGIEEEPDDEEPIAIPGVTDEAARLRRDKEYWERELDVKMVFNFLKQRFSSRPTSPEPAGGPLPHALQSGNGSAPAVAAGLSSPITSARRAAMIRQHHPLVGSTSVDASKQQSKRRELMHRQQQYGIPQHMRSGSGRFSGSGRSRSASVASQTSAKKSKRSMSGSSRSRNFWDAGGSQVGSSSAVGVWGEA